MVQRVAGLKASISLITDVGKHSQFGSHFVLTQLEDMPYLEINEKEFIHQAEIEQTSGRTKSAAALKNAAKILAQTNDQWSRAVEEALYNGYGIPYPLE